MRILAFGDIHGCYKSFTLLLEMIHPRKDDLIIILGDFVGRGDESCSVVNQIIKLSQNHNVITIRGNHEQFMIDSKNDNAYRNNWISSWGSKVIQSYPNNSYDEIPLNHWEFLINECIDWYETETHIFVHAHVDPDLEMPEQDIMTLYYKSLHYSQRHKSGKIIICGHNVQTSTYPTNLGHTVCIDTGSGLDGMLTCLNVQNGNYWQCDENNKTRIGSLNIGF